MSEFLHLSVEIERGSDPIRGQVQADSLPPQPFDSWLELVTTLHHHIELSGETNRQADPEDEGI